MRADSEFSLTLWKNENIEGYNRCDPIGLWKVIRALLKKQYADKSE